MIGGGDVSPFAGIFSILTIFMVAAAVGLIVGVVIMIVLAVKNRASQNNMIQTMPMKRYCIKCGARIEEGNAFCNFGRHGVLRKMRGVSAELPARAGESGSTYGPRKCRGAGAGSGESGPEACRGAGRTKCRAETPAVRAAAAPVPAAAGGLWNGVQYSD